jgi:DNA polymerase-3 subunit alpha
MTLKAVVRKVFSAYDMPMRGISQIIKTIPNDVKTLQEAYDKSKEFKDNMDMYVDEFNIMLQLEGLMSHISKHAAGVAICSKPIKDVIPCMSDSEDRSMLMSQWEKKTLEKVGVYKFDFLGIKTLTLMRRTVELIKKNYNIDVDLDKIDVNDRCIYEQLNSFDLSGVFQFAEPAGKQAIQQIKPKCFNDVVAAEALCRPGVKEKELYLRNRTLKPDEYSTGNKEVDDILKETYGAIVYQEQTMLIMNRLTGGRWTLGKADSMRKVKNLEDYREDFVQCCMDNNVSTEFANWIFNRFSMDYSFNKSHAASYAVVSCRCSYLKSKFYKEFMAALMSIKLIDKAEEIPLYINEIRLHNIKVLTPDVNESNNSFDVKGDMIRCPLNLISNVGDKSIQTILNKRPFTDFNDFIQKCVFKNSNVNKRVISNLIKAGAFDSIMQEYMGNRNRLLEHYTKESQYVWSKEIALRYEHELTGTYFSGHPLDDYNIVSFEKFPDGNAYLTGILTEKKCIFDKNNNEMAFIRIENQYESVEAIIFARTFNKYKRFLIEGVKLRISGRKEDNKMLADKIEVI